MTQGILKYFLAEKRQERELLIDACGNYTPAFMYALHFLLKAREDRERTIKQSKKYIKTPQKISYDQIDNILGNAFAIHPEEAREVRISYLKKKPVKRKRKKDLKIRMRFNPKSMKAGCLQLNIRISSQEIEFMLILSNYALPVSTVIQEHTDIPLHKETYENVKKWASKIKKYIGGIDDLKRWQLFFKYFRQLLIDCGLTYLAFFVRVPYEKICHINSQFDRITSFCSISKIINKEKLWKYLLEYREELANLPANNQENVNDCSDFFTDYTVCDLYNAYLCKELIKLFAVFPIRTEDLYLLYIYNTHLDEEAQNLVLEQVNQYVDLE